MSVEDRWDDRKGDLVGPAAKTIALPSELAIINDDGALVPEFGQSVSTAQLQAIQGLARQIVSLMESPW
jgi:hypothetical protein